MNILLVQKFAVIEPLGLMIIGNAMKTNGHNIDYFLYKGRTIEIPNPDKYDIIGFSTFTGNHNEVYECCGELRKKGIKTAIGGPHATFFYTDCRKYSDYVFRGESVISFPKLDDKTIYPLVDPDTLLPDRDGFYKQSEYHKNSKIKNIMTSFGCPFTCSYCYNSLYKQLYGNIKIRLRSVDSIISEASNLSCDLIFFQDDFFGFNKKWLYEFNEKWNKRPYHAQMRIETVDDEKIELFKNSGCISITVAIEAFSEEYREKKLNRKMKNVDIITNCKKILDAGIKLRTEQMLGLPETTIDDELKLLKLNCEIRPTIAWTSIFQPYRGTALGEYCIENKLYEGDNSDVADSFFKESVLKLSADRKEQIVKLQKIFAMCAHIPDGWKYAEQIIMFNNDNIKEHLYSILYNTGKHI